MQHPDSGDFKKSLSHEYRLSLKLGVNGISYLIVDGMGKALSFKQYLISDGEKLSQSFKSFFTSENRLLLNYKSILIALDSNRFTLIPNRLFKEKDRTLYLNTSGNSEYKKEFVGQNKIAFNQSHIIFGWDDELIGLLKNYFPSGRLYHSVTAMLHGWKKQSEIKEGKKVYIHVENTYFTIAFFEESELIFINRFHFKTAADFLYYVLMVFDQFELKPESTPVILSGELVENSEIYKKLYRYIRHIGFIPNIGYYEFGEAFSNLTHYHHFDLYSLKLCG